MKLDFASILTVVLPVYLTMAAGAAARRLKVLPREADAGLMKLSITLLTPCLILERVAGNESVMSPLPVPDLALHQFVFNKLNMQRTASFYCFLASDQ